MSKIKVETTIAAPANKVWAYYTNPEHVTKWNFASDDWCCPSASNDLKVGGRFVARMEAKDKSFGFDFEVTWDEVVENKKLAYTMADGREATISFEDAGGKTKVSTVFDAETMNPEEMQREGWQAILNNFKKYVEAN